MNHPHARGQHPTLPHSFSTAPHARSTAQSSVFALGPRPESTETSLTGTIRARMATPERTAPSRRLRSAALAERQRLRRELERLEQQISRLRSELVSLEQAAVSVRQRSALLVQLTYKDED